MALLSREGSWNVGVLQAHVWSNVVNTALSLVAQEEGMGGGAFDFCLLRWTKTEGTGWVGAKVINASLFLLARDRFDLAVQRPLLFSEKHNLDLTLPDK